ncbi:MAG: acyltransferase [Promethearchaeota archaeon]
MSSPSSFKMDHPSPVPGHTRRRHILLYLFIIWSSSVPAILFEYYIYYQYLYVRLGASWFWGKVLFWVLLPFDILFVLYLTFFSALVVARFFLLFVHRPREGVFDRDPKDRDFRAWGLRNLIRKWPLWLLSSMPFPWLRGRFVLKHLGSKVKVGKHCSLVDGFVTPELVEIGDGVVLGQSAVVTSYHFEDQYFIVRKVVVGDCAIIGARVTILPGTKIGEHATVSAESYTIYHQEVEPRAVYRGKPAKRIGFLPAETTKTRS